MYIYYENRTQGTHKVCTSLLYFVVRVRCRRKESSGEVLVELSGRICLPSLNMMCRANRTI